MNPTFTTKYTLINKIGEGSFSEVLKCEEKETKKYFAAKRLKKTFKSTYEVANCAEIIAMNKLERHPNIVYMLEFYYEPGNGELIFVFELMDMSLYDFMKLKRRRISESRVQNYLYQILKGLNHLHIHGLFHRDIKPENILVKMSKGCNNNCAPYQSDQEEIVKLADFGSIRGIFSKPPYTEYISTRWYRSPECLLSVGYYGPKMDVWATGCVFYEMLTLRPLFPGHDEIDQLAKIHDVLGTPTERMIRRLKKKSRNFSNFPKQIGTGLKSCSSKISENAVQVLQLMIQYDPDSRINVRRLLDHKYFKNLREDDNLRKIKSSKAYSNEYLSRSNGDFSSSLSFPIDSKRNKYKTSSSRSSSRGAAHRNAAPELPKPMVDIANYKQDFKQNHNLLANHLPLVGQKQMKSWGVNPEILKSKDEIKKKSNTSTNNKSQQFKLKQTNVSDTHRFNHSCKTTSNLPQIPNYSNYQNIKAKQFQSKSFVLPSRRIVKLVEKKPEKLELPSIHKLSQVYKNKKKAQ